MPKVVPPSMQESLKWHFCLLKVVLKYWSFDYEMVQTGCKLHIRARDQIEIVQLRKQMMVKWAGTDAQNKQQKPQRVLIKWKTASVWESLAQ